jgi:uncharacterized OsmC-like protein
MTCGRQSPIVELAATARIHKRTERTRKMTQTEAPTIDNGVNIEALRGARQALTDAPEAAQFQWRARCQWVNGTHSRSTITDFSGLGEQHSHRQAYTIEADHPEVFASEDNGATPPEIVLGALASCLTAGVATVATNRGVQLRSVVATIQADMDLQGILGIDADVRNGFDRIVLNYEIDADASREDIEAIVAQSQKRSAVFDIVTNPTTVQVTVA